jgi:hypothetical protein
MYTLVLIHSDTHKSTITGVSAFCVEKDRLYIKSTLSPMAELVYQIGYDCKHPECTIFRFEFYAE